LKHDFAAERRYATTNVLAAVTAGIAVAGYAVMTPVRRHFARSSQGALSETSPYGNASVSDTVSLVSPRSPASGAIAVVKPFALSSLTATSRCRTP